MYLEQWSLRSLVGGQELGIEWAGCGHGNVAEHVGPNGRVKGLPDLEGGGRIKMVKYA